MFFFASKPWSLSTMLKKNTNCNQPENNYVHYISNYF